MKILRCGASSSGLPIPQSARHNSGMPPSLTRRTVIVEGPLAFRMRRLAAARNGEHGLHIASLPSLAGRLAGGFIRPAEEQELDPAIQIALAAGGFRELEAIRELPGTSRAVARTL